MCQVYAGQAPESYEPVTRRIRLNGHSTSIRFERSFWRILDGMARREGVSTPVQADATDLAPEVAVDTPMDSSIDGLTVTDGADATSSAEGGAAQDVASDVNAGTDGAAATATDDAVSEVQQTAADTEPGTEPEVPTDGTMDAGVEATAEAGAEGDDAATADAATSQEVAAAGTEQEAGAGGPATPTEGTTLSKSAVCEVSRETADSLGIALPG